MTDIRITYRDAGVDIDAANDAVQRIKRHVRSTFTPGVLTDVGSFSGMFSLSALPAYQNPVLVSSIDGVGTKLKVAIAVGKHDTIGRDLVNHCINDILVQGARPLFFLDYFATGKLSPPIVEDIVKGLAEGCRESGCALVGGETAEMPGLYADGDYDLAGCIVGIIERDRIIDGSRVQPGDTLVGLASSGLHTNGYSLARHVLLDGPDPIPLNEPLPILGRSLAEELLAPHRCYAPRRPRAFRRVRHSWHGASDGRRVLRKHPAHPAHGLQRHHRTPQLAHPAHLQPHSGTRQCP